MHGVCFRSDPYNGDGWSPVMMAAKGRFNDLIEVLISEHPGIGIHHKNHCGLI